ncbi:tetratricopeptide repeat protein [Streptomyces xantholiticus]|uniref:Tetratricopeptide repeat protein n=1 Tax=Streptomyces xantholiticus TaxID=68285 RepID=A0ABV1V4U4_9ACTN
MAGKGGPDFRVVNSISGSGVYLGPVIQGRDVTVQLPPRITPAMAGLPELSAAFTGRDEHLKTLLAHLAPGGRGGQQAVLVTAVSGLAGVGKTELAAQTTARALEQPDWFTGGVLFIDLHGYDPVRCLSPEQALDGLLRALAVPGDHIPAGLQGRQRLYRSILAAYAEEGQRVLVVADNASTAGQARPLLPTDGVNAALVTSRHTLDIGACLYDLDVLEKRHAIEMLDRALRHARGRDDTRISDDPEAAARIARLCAGLPLALSIAAALLADDPTRTRTAASLGRSLEAEHTRLRRLRREDRAVRAAFDLSYRQLDQQHARFFRLLPLNPGPDVSTEAAAQLAGIEELDAEEILESLARAHLLGPARTWGRWRMHDLVRLYADEHGRHQADADRREAALARLFTHYQDTATAADAHVNSLAGSRSPRFRDRVHALQWLDAEHANLIATATTAPRRGHPQTTAILAFGLAAYLDRRRYFGDWITLTTTALAIVREAGDRLDGGPAYEGQALNNLGLALRQVRRFDEAIDAHTRAADIFRELDDRDSEGQALNNLGAALAEVRRFDEAIDAHARAADIHCETGDRHLEGTALANLSAVLAEVGRFDEAIDAHTRAAGIVRETGDRKREGMVLGNLGLVLHGVGRFDEAIDAHARAAGIFCETGDRHHEGLALNNLGAALAEVRRFDEAIDAHTRAAGIFCGTGDRHHEGTARDRLGLALADVRRFDEAIDAHTRAAGIFRETSARKREGIVLCNLGLVLQGVGRFDEAIDAHTRAVGIFRKFGDRNSEGMVLGNLGLALQGVGRFDEAIDAHTRAVGIFRETGHRDGEATALDNLGTALQGVGRFDEAIDAHTRAVGIFRKFGDRNREATALNNLGLALNGVGRSGEAAAAVEQAVGICRSQSGSEPDLARRLLVLALLRANATDEADLPGALAAAEEAVALLGGLAAGRPGAFSGLLRAALELLAVIREGLGHAEETQEVRGRITDLDPPEM